MMCSFIESPATSAKKLNRGGAKVLVVEQPVGEGLFGLRAEGWSAA